ncbi:hypothetical protein Gogos_018038 [Gossypium gossypioides]|uniref:Uncharacterized protein n=1 Tax=Gossypium gossypioides TaxID=34282 RepID=A0A7J9BCV0_GOSGO|nr:hypothetical protein [Gossypium gossypioides]
MEAVLNEFFVLNQEFYENHLCSYADELKYLGVRFEFDDIQILLTDRFKSFTFTSLNKEQTDLLLMFININEEKNMFDRDGWMLLETINGYELSQCYNAPKESLYLQLEIEVEAIMKIINLLIVDESFYGSKPSSFSTELNMLGVMFNMKQVYELIAQNFSLRVDVASVYGNCALLILKCIRYTNSTTRDGFIESVLQWLWLSVLNALRDVSFVM